MLEKREDVRGRALLVGLNCPGLAGFDNSDQETMEELDELVKTAGGVPVLRAMQNRHTPDPHTFIGEGKCEELAELIKTNEIDLVIFDNEISPSQGRALEEALSCRVIDRNALILDIFADRAKTSEGKLQVEIACLRYTAPRLIGKGKMLSRQGGGIGSRGPGESKLESDRRHIRRRIEALEAELDELERTRGVKRSQRMRSGLATVAIIGYTNAGKSTLLNRLTDAGILAEDKLFATLDPTTRRLTLPGGTEVLLTDTVGFIDRLPTHLVRAFRSTLEELTYCDVILCLTDGSEEAGERTRKRAVTEKLIGELGAGEKPILEVYNKTDLVDKNAKDLFPGNVLEISAATGAGIDTLLSKLEETVNGGKKVLKLFFSHNQSGKAAEVYRFATVNETEYTENGTLITALCDERAQGMFSQFVQE